MLALEAGAREHGYHRLELTVPVHNERASALYESLGYEREGLRRHGFKVNGTDVDLYYMTKLIETQT
jgi:RimJ/RimL family protein N-acetyltransferase